MNQTTPEQAERLIDYLADKRVNIVSKPCDRNLPVLIGNVLEKMNPIDK